MPRGRISGPLLSRARAGQQKVAAPPAGRKFDCSLRKSNSSLAHCTLSGSDAPEVNVTQKLDLSPFGDRPGHVAPLGEAARVSRAEIQTVAAYRHSIFKLSHSFRESLTGGNHRLASEPFQEIPRQENVSYLPPRGRDGDLHSRYQMLRRYQCFDKFKPFATLSSQSLQLGRCWSSQALARVRHPAERLSGVATTGGVGHLRMQQIRGARVTGSNVRVGHILDRKGRMLQVMKIQHTQQGRGGAIIQVELRDVQSGLKSNERLRTSEDIELIFADNRKFEFLYQDGDDITLMDPATFEQMTVPRSFFGDSAAYLIEGMEVSVQYLNGDAMSASVAPRLTCLVDEAEPYFKGQTATPVYKKVKLQNGLTVQVPGFVEKGDLIVIDTSDNSYVTRAKVE